MIKPSRSHFPLPIAAVSCVSLGDTPLSEKRHNHLCLPMRLPGGLFHGRLRLRARFRSVIRPLDLGVLQRLLFFFYLSCTRISRLVQHIAYTASRLLVLFFLSSVCRCFRSLASPQDRGEWQLGAFFLVMPAHRDRASLLQSGITARATVAVSPNQ